MAISNPYLSDQASAITNQANQNLMNYQLPQINGGAMMAGGFGGSRQGVAQGLAIGQTNQGITNSLAGLYGSAYNADQDRANQMGIAQMQNSTQRYGIDSNSQLGNKQADNSYTLGLGNLGLGNKQADNSYNLGLGQLGLGQRTADQNFYTNQRGQDLSQYGLGANIANQGNLGLSNQGQQLFQNGQQQQQAPWQALQNYGNALSPFTRLNGSTSNTQPGASAIGSAIGGGITLAQLYQILNQGH